MGVNLNANAEPTKTNLLNTKQKADKAAKNDHRQKLLDDSKETNMKDLSSTMTLDEPRDKCLKRHNLKRH